MRYLLDTNVISDMMKDPRGSVAQNIARVGADAVFTSVVVAAEVRYGIVKRGSKRLADQYEAIAGSLAVADLDEAIVEHYATIRAQMDKAGRAIGQNDLLIAAQAKSLDATVVTKDVAFSRIEGLKVESWSSP